MTASPAITLPELEDLKLDVPATGTYFSPQPDSPFDQREHPHGDDHSLRGELLTRIEDFAGSDPNVKYVGAVVDALTNRIYERGGCTFAERDTLQYAVAAASAATARAVALKYVRTVEIELADLEDDR